MSQLIRISKIGGRYLLFDIDDVVLTRREHCICATFTGTLPQAPMQNVFLGLPLELCAEEALLLVEKGVAYVEDEAAVHLAQFRAATKRPLRSEQGSNGAESRRAFYLDSLASQTRIIEDELAKEAAERAKIGAVRKDKNNGKRKVKPKGNTSSSDQASAAEVEVDDNEDALFSPAPAPAPAPPPQQSPRTKLPRQRYPLFITPSTSLSLLPPPPSAPSATAALITPKPKGFPLFKHLNSKGFYMHPGIRFGADYSVYPGDPFRYHAHFMATSYKWDEEIKLLDLVSAGRLGTGVKKAFLIGGEVEMEEDEDQEGNEQRKDKKDGGSGGEEVRCFSIEWAAI